MSGIFHESYKLDGIREEPKSGSCNYTNKRKSLVQSMPAGMGDAMRTLEESEYYNSRLITSLTTHIKTKQTVATRGARAGAILPRIRVINLRNA